MRERLHSLAAWQQHLGALPGQPGGGGCSQTWWRRWLRHRSATAAGLSQPSPNDWKCAKPSGRPTERERRWHFTLYFVIVCFPQGSGRRSVLTLDLVSTLAPFFRRYRTTSAWPALAAMWRAVSPRWRTQKCLSEFQKRKPWAEWKKNKNKRYRTLNIILLQHWWCWVMLRDESVHGRCFHDPWMLPHGWALDQTAGKQYYVNRSACVKKKSSKHLKN